MFRWYFSPALFLIIAVIRCAAQSPAANRTTDNSFARSTVKTSNPTAAPAPNAGTSVPKKVWTNDDLDKGNGSVSVVGEKRNQKYSMTKEPDPAAVAKVRQNLEKLQSQLDDVNKQLATYKQFQDGETVSDGGRQVNKGYNRTPVNQQMATLQEKKKKLQDQIDELLDEARKKGIEPRQLW
jgi:hypothetical protein